jgi:4-amino-4-deoxy-L-arabinose transferase-like glycosyltransferase
VPNALSAAPIIIETGKPVMALGGFAGIDPILTQQKLIDLIQNGTVRFFLMNGAGTSTQDTTAQQSEQPSASNTLFGANLTTWVTNHCTVIPQSEWSMSQSSSGGGQQLYNCSTTH